MTFQTVTATRVRPYVFQFPYEGHTWECTVLEAEHCPTLTFTVQMEPGLPEGYCTGAVFGAFNVRSHDADGFMGKHGALECLLVQTPEQKAERSADFMERWEADQADARAQGQVWRLRTAPDGCSMPVVL
jgi:hypothetical protein